MLRWTVVVLYLILSCAAWGQAAKRSVVRSMPGPEERTSRYLDSIRNQPSLLLAFLNEMPKGGDLHTHLSGAVYAENYIRWAAQDALCINVQALAFVASPCDADKGVPPATQVLQNSALYQQVINALSMRFFNGPESGHDHFFNTFGKFGPVSRSRQGDMLAEVVSRAAAQKVSYMEILLSPDKGEAGRFPAANSIAWTEDFNAMRTALLDKGIAKVVANSRSNLDQFEARMKDVLHCSTPEADPGCDVTVRYQYEIHRGLPPEVVFAEMVVGFELAKADPRVVDLNPVMPEDAFIPMQDFDLHMRMLDYLHGLYPNVPLSLHAGELWLGLVPPDGLRNHIRDSIQRGHARRIGHGVDVMFEDDAPALLRQMAANKIAVEINLTSNDLILGVRGDEHPLPMYLKAGIPVAISTDDEGVSRSNITHEYERAVHSYAFSYRDLKNIVRNSLEYAFLPGKSLWVDGTYAGKVSACGKTGATCDQFLNTNEKARLQWKLEQDFQNFEANWRPIATIGDRSPNSGDGPLSTGTLPKAHVK